MRRSTIPGSCTVIKFVYDIVETANTRGRFAFTKTRETMTGEMPRFSVTLGILPDYAFNGGGVRADGVSQGRPAEKAGLNRVMSSYSWEALAAPWKTICRPWGSSEKGTRPPSGIDGARTRWNHPSNSKQAT